MAKQTVLNTVMFADIVGSVPLFDKYGDHAAKEAIEDWIRHSAEIVKRFQGTLVRTIGDEIMCCFNHPDDAVNAACEINDSMCNPFGRAGIYMKVHTGLQHGEIIVDETDVYGDAVNMASRMTGIAKAEQIITTRDTWHQLSDELKAKSREFDAIAVKGKPETITIYDIVWSLQTDHTDLTGVRRTINLKPDSMIELTYFDQTVRLTRDQVPFSIGRSSSCNLVVNSRLASRSHVILDYSRGKFVAVDNSTNGTFLKPENDKQVYFRREGMFLGISGVISLGGEIEESNRHIISFRVF